MRVCGYARARELRTPQLAPDACVSQIEALLRSVPVDGFAGFTSLVIFDVVVQSHQGNAGATVIGGVLAESEPSIELEIVDGSESAVFISDATGTLFEFLCVLRSPPIAEVALRIVLTALIIEAVRKFMTDHHADAAKVGGIVSRLVEEWRLQD